MRIGIFAKTFVRSSLAEVFDAVRQSGLAAVQFNLSCAGLPTLPEHVDDDLCDCTRRLAAERGIELAAISGTFNMIHPDARQRGEGLQRFAILARAARRIGIPVITLCTGTRDPQDMWHRHPHNDTPAAWADLVASLGEALRIAADQDVTLGVEPEVSNVIDSAPKCRRLLDEIGSPRLKVVMDGANLFHAGQLARMREILDVAFDLLGRDLVLAHAKDLVQDGEAGDRAAGTGLLDYDHYLGLMRQACYDGPLILHGLAESQVPQSVAFLRMKLAAGKKTCET
jgi:sugar phosphate isomerase/epimerase